MSPHRTATFAPPTAICVELDHFDWIATRHGVALCQDYAAYLRRRVQNLVGPHAQIWAEHPGQLYIMINNNTGDNLADQAQRLSLDLCAAVYHCGTLRLPGSASVSLTRLNNTGLINRDIEAQYYND